MVEVPVTIPIPHEHLAAQDPLYRYLQRDLEELVPALRLDPSEKSKVVFQVFDHIEHQNEIKKGVVFLRDVRQFEMKPFIGPPFAHFNRLGRNIVSPECAGIAHLHLQEPEHLANAASNLADRLRLEVMSLQHRDDVLDFPGDFSTCQVGFIFRY